MGLPLGAQASAKSFATAISKVSCGKKLPQQCYLHAVLPAVTHLYAWPTGKHVFSHAVVCMAGHKQQRSSRGSCKRLRISGAWSILMVTFCALHQVCSFVLPLQLPPTTAAERLLMLVCRLPLLVRWPRPMSTSPRPAALPKRMSHQLPQMLRGCASFPWLALQSRCPGGLSSALAMLLPPL